MVVTHADDPVTRGQSGRVILSDLAARRWVHFTPDSGLPASSTGPAPRANEALITPAQGGVRQ